MFAIACALSLAAPRLCLSFANVCPYTLRGFKLFAVFSVSNLTALASRASQGCNLIYDPFSRARALAIKDTRAQQGDAIVVTNARCNRISEKIARERFRVSRDLATGVCVCFCMEAVVCVLTDQVQFGVDSGARASTGYVRNQDIYAIDR